MSKNKVKSPYYMHTIKALTNGTFLLSHSMLMDLQDELWFDEEHAKSDIMKALRDYENN